MRMFVLLVLSWSNVAFADECAELHARLDGGAWQEGRREVLLANETPEDACTYALWARLSERDGQRLRASVFWLRAKQLLEDEPAERRQARWARQAMRRAASVRETPRVRRALAATTAREPAPMPTLRELADTTCLRAIGYAPRCAVVRRVGSIAVLREVSGVFHEADTFWIAARSDAGWTLVTTLDMIGNGRGVVGAHELREFRLAQVVPGGEPELDARVHADVGEMTACGTERRDETRRTVCRMVDGAWQCHHWTVQVGAMRYVPHPDSERGCSAPPPAPGWSVELDFATDTVDVRATSGTPPPSAGVGRQDLDRVFGQ